MKRVLKWTVPVDDRAHNIGAGPVVHVDVVGDPGTVQVWTEEVVGVARTRPAQVFGTGHEVPQALIHLGTAVCEGGALVWHVYGWPHE